MVDRESMAVLASALAIQISRATLDVGLPVEASASLALDSSQLSMLLGYRWLGVLSSMIIIFVFGTHFVGEPRVAVPRLVSGIGASLCVLKFSGTSILFTSFALYASGAFVAAAALCMNVLVQVLSSSSRSKSRLNALYRFGGGVSYAIHSVVIGSLMKSQDTRVDSVAPRVAEKIRVFDMYPCTAVIVFLGAAILYTLLSSSCDSWGTGERKKSSTSPNFLFLFRRCRRMVAFASIVALLATAGAISRSVMKTRFIDELGGGERPYANAHGLASALSLVATYAGGVALSRKWVSTRCSIIASSYVMAAAMVVIAMSNNLMIVRAAIACSRAAEDAAKVPVGVWLADMAAERTIPHKLWGSPSEQDRRPMAAALASCIAFQKLLGACLKALASGIVALHPFSGVNDTTQGVYVACAVIYLSSGAAISTFRMPLGAEDEHTKEKFRSE